MKHCRLSEIRLHAAAVAIAAAPACTVTPIDAVTELNGAGSTGTGTTATGSAGIGGSSGTGTAGGLEPLGVGICDAGPVPAPGSRYLIIARSTGACMTAGGVTKIEGALSMDAMGNEVYLDANCSGVVEQMWELYPQPQGGLGSDTWYVEVRNQALDLNLDMEAAGVFDGTRALLYEPHTMENQRFYFDARGPDYYAIRPAHVANHCLQQMDDGQVKMYGCEGDFGLVDLAVQAAQEWRLASEDCL